MENENVVSASLVDNEIADTQLLSSLVTSDPSVYQLKLVVERDSSSRRLSSEPATAICNLIPFINGLSYQAGEPNLDEISLSLNFTGNHPETNPVSISSDDPNCMISSSEGVYNKVIEFESIEVGEELSVVVTLTWGTYVHESLLDVEVSD